MMLVVPATEQERCRACRLGFTVAPAAGFSRPFSPINSLPSSPSAYPPYAYSALDEPGHLRSLSYCRFCFLTPLFPSLPFFFRYSRRSRILVPFFFPRRAWPSLHPWISEKAGFTPPQQKSSCSFSFSPPDFKVVCPPLSVHVIGTIFRTIPRPRVLIAIAEQYPFPSIVMVKFPLLSCDHPLRVCVTYLVFPFLLLSAPDRRAGLVSLSLSRPPFISWPARLHLMRPTPSGRSSFFFLFCRSTLFFLLPDTLGEPGGSRCPQRQPLSLSYRRTAGISDRLRRPACLACVLLSFFSFGFSSGLMF